MLTPGGIAAPAQQLLAHRVVALRQAALHPLQQVDAVGVVVAGDEFAPASGLRVRPAGLEQQVHDAARGLVHDVGAAVTVAAAAVVQVRDVELVHLFVVHQSQDLRQFVGVVLGRGEAHAHLDAGLVTQADGAQRGVEGTRFLTEAVMGVAECRRC